MYTKAVIPRFLLTDITHDDCSNMATVLFKPKDVFLAHLRILGGPAGILSAPVRGTYHATNQVINRNPGTASANSKEASS